MATTNIQLEGLIQMLKKQSSEQNVNIWKRIAEDLEKPRRQRRVVNLYKLDKYTKDNETVIVPGKVLATGDIKHKINIAAWDFSDGAIRKIVGANGKCLSIPEMLEKNPKGQKMRILG